MRCRSPAERSDAIQFEGADYIAVDIENELDPGSFMASERGLGERFGVFEDDLETGYFYVYDRSVDRIIHAIHVYDRSELLQVSSNDVDVVWAQDGSKAAVAVFGKMAGIVDLRANVAARCWLEDPHAWEGIQDRSWLSGLADV